MLKKKGAGRGGISRGRGDAEMTWGSETEGRTDLFKPKLLEPSAPPDPKDSMTMGLSGKAPEAKPEAEGSTTVDVEGSAGKAAWRRRLAPHHRDAVKSYFSQPNEGAEKKR